MRALKNDTLFEDGSGDPPSSISQRVAAIIAARIETIAIASFFRPPPLLIPVPKSSLHKDESLWVPLQLADALLNRGLGDRVAPLLRRTVAIPKAATSIASERPRARLHFDTLAVQTELGPAPASFLLVDDIVTRGAALVGAASRLGVSYPGIPIKAFAAIRTESDPANLAKITDPRVEIIRLRNDGTTLRRPI